MRPGFAFAASAAWLACLPVHAESSAVAAGIFRLTLTDAATYKLNKGVGGDNNFALAPTYRKVETTVADVSPVLAEKPFAPMIEQAARSSNLDPALVHAVIHVESRHNAQAISPKGAIGLMQVMPATASRYGIGAQQRSPAENLTAGTRYLKDLLQMFDNRMDLALAAYNAGEGAVIRHGGKIPPYRETQHYVPAVLAKYKEWKIEKPSRHEYLPGTQLNTDAILRKP